MSAGEIVFMGPPGSGKGTQARRLVDAKGWVHLSTGELFRLHARVGSELGNLARSFMDRGEYVPDDVTVRMVRERLREIPASTRILFDGFPRTGAQAIALDKLLSEFGRAVGAVLLLEVPRQELIDRITKRAAAEFRTDDTAEVVGTRLDVYEKQTAPVIEQYERRGLLRRVKGLGSIDEVAGRLAKALD
ncbi:MAG TPA: adenylate kinase [Candidatus Limnocylindria bacterium]|nr:adenylate kinase [Candidatus Limnocylindria bacterium]